MVPNDTTARLTSMAIMVLADLETQRARAWDAGLLDAARKAVYAARHVITAVTGNYAGDEGAREIMAWAAVEVDE